MQTKRKPFILIVSLFLIITFSCAKHTTYPDSPNRVVSYSLTSSNYQPFSDISYTDADGAPATASAADSVSAWSKTITTTINPFNAQMEVQGLNNTSAQINYTVSIFVSGVIISSKQDSVAPFKSFDTQLAAVVQ